MGIKRRFPSIYGDEIWKFQIILRKHEYYQNCSKNILMRYYYGYKHKKYGFKLGFSIPCNVFGAGLRINHFGNIVVNSEAEIGEWCDIHQGVNIGQNIEKNSVPKIGDNVWIGPGVKIFGDIVLGNNMMLAANAVVNKSFEEGNCRVGGVPAKVISDNPNCYHRDENVQ